MTTFTNFKYTRPDLTAFEAAFNKTLAEFTTAKTPETASIAMQSINGLRENFDSMKNIADIRHTMNTEDPFYEAENDFFDEAEPLVAGFTSQYYRTRSTMPNSAASITSWYSCATASPEHSASRTSLN